MVTRKAVPPPPPPAARLAPSRAAGTKNQEDFAEQAAELCSLLGWDGDPTDQIPETYTKRDGTEFTVPGISVRDARRYVQKVLHEHHQAAARGLPRPDASEACRHLKVDTPEEQSAIDAVLAEAYDSGKGLGFKVESAVPTNISANISGSAAAAARGASMGAAKARAEGSK